MQRPPSNRQLMERHLRQIYGNELFDGQQYVIKGRVGITGMPISPSVPSNSEFQAMRGRILGPLPRGTFAGTGSDDEDSEDDDDYDNSSNAVFAWCDRNNSAEDVAKTCARRAGAKITMRRGLPKWIFLYFRVRRVSWEFMVYEEKMNCSTVDLFSDNVLDRWTVKLRFKMLVDAPMKYPLMAFLSRMGLDTDPDIVFSTDGFFGDMLVGGLRSKNSIPHRQVSFNTTPEAMGLQNGDNIFVVKANSTLRNNVEAHIEMAKRRANKAEGEDDDEEEEDVEDDEEEK
ncbi:hypothetical protein BOX15_Mlig029560g4 [Macrostomum lignano]|nr:hypothetical protein BOX15_Mlig029560g4 [Macrostomum lignano]